VAAYCYKKITSGNTRITPGPVLSEFKTANVPTKLDQGTIWVNKDTLVAKPSDVISTPSSLLSKCQADWPLFCQLLRRSEQDLGSASTVQRKNLSGSTNLSSLAWTKLHDAPETVRQLRSAAAVRSLGSRGARSDCRLCTVKAQMPLSVYIKQRRKGRGYTIGIFTILLFFFK